jgi:low temperature requirement protein LtrA
MKVIRRSIGADHASAGTCEDRGHMSTTPAEPLEPGAEDEHRVAPLELFFDLVFVLAITQVTLFFSKHLTATGFAEGLVLLALLWWSWVGYSWLTNAIDTEDTRTRLSFFVAMAAFTVVALSIPRAYGDDALTFAIAYAITRVMQVGLYAYGTDDDDPNHGAILRLAPGFLASSALIVAGALVGGDAQLWIWLAAIVLDVATPLIRGAEGFRVHAGHFAERHGLILIIALGESIVALGSGVEADDVDGALIAGAALGVAAAAALWWAYFDIVAVVAEHRLGAARGADRARMARDSYSYFHFLMIAGIVLLALGIKKVLAGDDEPLKTIPAIALCVGPALYYLGHIAFRLRNVGSLNRQRLVAALVLLALIPLVREIDALPALAIVTGVLAALVAYEALRFGSHRREWLERIRAEGT